jgi:hypothetical protein
MPSEPVQTIDSGADFIVASIGGLQFSISACADASTAKEARTAAIPSKRTAFVIDLEVRHTSFNPCIG